jgi:thiol-disulfide isomerase/thioredoxin
MENLMMLLGGFQTVFTLENIGVCLLGAILGLVVGAMPGIGSLAGVALLLPLTACAETAVPEQQTAPNVVEILKKNTTLDLTGHLGKTVLINFFTEWCTYCMKEMPDMKEVNDLYDPESFQMILVHVWDGEDETNTENVKERFGMQHMTFWEDTDRMVASVVGVPGYPATLILNPDGTLAAGQSGMLTYDTLTAFLDELGVERVAAE